MRAVFILKKYEFKREDNYLHEAANQSR